MAAGRSSRLTSDGTIAFIAGDPNAVTNPRSRASPMMTGTVSHPATARSASVPVTIIEPICVPIISRLRSKRSAAAAGPRREEDDPRELRETDDADEEGRMRQPVDEQRLGDILEPGAAVREQVADEERAEVALPEHTKRGSGCRCSLGACHPGGFPFQRSIPTRLSIMTAVLRIIRAILCNSRIPRCILPCRLHYAKRWLPRSSPHRIAALLTTTLVHFQTIRCAV